MSQGAAIRQTDPNQDPGALQKVAGDISGILTPGEEIYYVALQGKATLSLKKDSVVATTNRLIFYRPQMLGRFNFVDFHWLDIKDVHMKQGFIASDFDAESTEGKKESMGGLDKDQTKRLYAICQQLEQEWREKRRERQMEEDRARAGNFTVNTPPTAAMQTSPPVQEDPVERLAKAKKMLDAALISQEEYDSLKARILSSM